ncbi:hypothetical protein PLA107_031535 (plasmid) [Pseudomonas amygdali pv. lachrymans str. M301315]|uniref:Uncharacterized protein n=2 Tax=Pseudomonas amygdali TaxID=47877 RepID=A0AAD0PVZ8_PSEAV|nr:hypothetical protein PLA107_031535 [Pseudomonas amygdali pv. lachrymans str. M301315]RMT05856.1 hypothetical protein ALP54_03658 [Pseudomonas amygdali pv. lachrymans]
MVLRALRNATSSVLECMGQMVMLHKDARKFFADFQAGSWTAEGFRSVAHHFEAALLHAVEQSIAADDLLQALMPGYCKTEQGQIWAQKLLNFMLASACASPTSNHARIFEAFDHYVEASLWEIRDYVGYLGDRGVTNIRALIKHSSQKRIEQTLHLAQSYYNTVMIDAIAWDDLDLFNQVSNHPSIENAKTVGLMNLVTFPFDPTSVIHQSLLTDNDDLDKLIELHCDHLFNQVQVGFTHGIVWHRNSPEAGITLFPNGRSEWERAVSSDSKTFSLPQEWRGRLKSNPFGALEAFFQPTPKFEVRTADGWDWVDRVTQGFLDAGVSASQIISYGACRMKRRQAPVSLGRALDELGDMTPAQVRFHTHAYRVYFRDYKLDRLVENCVSDASLVALYKVTQNQDVLKYANDRVRDLALSSDLGL